MRWDKQPFFGKKVAEHKGSIVHNLNEGKPQPLVYLLVPATGSNLLDILSAEEFYRPYYKEREDTVILGVALGYPEALEVARTIVDAMYQTTGGFDLRHYIDCK